MFAQSNGIEYFYDENSSPIAFAYNGEVYYYKKDLLGNIIEILDTTGTTVVKYTYDAWGNHTVTDYTDFGLSSVNPIRYRSYYYDTETGLYFLQTRYYDPQIGRFINVDDISYLDPENINGLNLYAYCLNNPIMMADNNGCSPAWWEWLVSGIALVAGIVLCIIPGGQVFGVGLIVAGASGLISNTMDAAGVDGKVASIVTNALNIIGGIALCFTPFASIGASMIGSGVLGIAGGYISEALGGSFTFGSAIGNIVGGFLGGQLYKGLTTTKLFRAVNSAEANSISKTKMFSEGAGQMEGKFFATKKIHASQWGVKLGSNKLISIRIPKSALSHSSVEYFKYRLDGIGPAYYFSDLDFLNSVFTNIKFF